MESKGLIRVSRSPFQLNTSIETGFWKDSQIASSSFPEARIFLQRSDLLAVVCRSVSISPSRRSKKGAVGFSSSIFCLKNSFCKSKICFQFFRAESMHLCELSRFRTLFPPLIKFRGVNLDFENSSFVLYKSFVLI